MKFEVTKIVEFDYDAEVSRINAAFEEPWKSRLLEITDAFKNEEYQKAVDLYDKLPYDEEDHNHSQEYCDYHMMDIAYKFIYNPESIKKIE